MAHTVPIGTQALVLPINKCVFSAGYKNALYLKQQGYNHYGIDLFSDSNQKVYACGNGEVLAAGLDGTNGVYSGLGYVAVILYKNVYVPSTKTVMDLVCRMFHFESLSVKTGDKVTKDTLIGLYGNTGGTLVNGAKMGYHLHIEFDKDTVYPMHAYGVSGTYSKIIKRGTVDSTLNPSGVWFIKSDSPDNQSIYGKYTGWYTTTDINLPKYSDIIWEKANGEAPKQSDSLIMILAQLASVKAENEVLNKRITDISVDFNKQIAELRTSNSNLQQSLDKAEAKLAQIKDILNK